MPRLSKLRPVSPARRFSNNSQRPRRAAPGQDGEGDPGRHPGAVPADHGRRHLPAAARRALYLQRARVRRRRLGRAARVGRQRRQGDPRRREGAAAQLQHQQPPRRHAGELQVGVLELDGEAQILMRSQASGLTQEGRRVYTR